MSDMSLFAGDGSLMVVFMWLLWEDSSFGCDLGLMEDVTSRVAVDKSGYIELI